MKKTIFYIIFLMLSFSFVLADMDDLDEAKKLIEQKVSCDELTEEQLEAIGDYYMELMHPGEAHEAMEEMMGGEGSESLRQVHLNMGYRFYCNKNLGLSGMGSGMMNMMMGGGNMMGSGMMGNFGYGMMGSFGYGYGILSLIVSILVIIILVLLAVWLYQKVTERRR